MAYSPGSNQYVQNAAGVWTAVGYGAANLPVPTIVPNASLAGTITATDVAVAAPVGNGVLLSGVSTTGSYVALQVPSGHADSIFQLTGTFGGGTVYTEMSADSTNGINGNWVPMEERQTGVLQTNLGYGFTAAGYYRGNIAGASWVRCRIVGATTPSVGVVIATSQGQGAVFLNAGLPPGTNNLGSVVLRDAANAGVTSTLAGVKQSLDVNLAASGSGIPQASAALTAAVADAQGTATTATAAGQVIAAVGLAGNLTFHLLAAAFVGTVVFEASINGGINYFPVMAIREDGTYPGQESSTSISTAAAFIRAYTTGVPGFTHFRVRCSAFTSGSLAVVVNQGAFLIEPSPSLGPSAAIIGTVNQNAAPPATVGAASGNIAAPFYATGTALVAAAAAIAAPGAGLSIYVTDMEGSNEGATGTAIAFSEGAATPVRYRRFLAASGGGFVTNLRTPWKLPANTSLWAAVSAATTWNYSINYYIAP